MKNIFDLEREVNKELDNQITDLAVHLLGAKNKPVKKRMYECGLLSLEKDILVKLVIKLVDMYPYEKGENNGRI